MNKENICVRPMNVSMGWIEGVYGSCLFEMGRTRVLCVVTIQDDVPPFLKGTGKGWLTCEYRMLPGASGIRISRERAANSGRTYEIQRLIGRSLRMAVDLDVIGERTIFVDVDVLQADGGTRTAGINGGLLALAMGLKRLEKEYGIPFAFSFRGIVSAISVGIVDGKIVVDLDYEKDSQAEVDMNVVMFEANEFIEIQGTGERNTFNMDSLNGLLFSAVEGIKFVYKIQSQVIEDKVKGGE